MDLSKFFKKNNYVEIAIIVISSFLAIATVVYSNIMANQLAKREENQVKQWAKATQDKAKLIKLSNEIFENLSKEEHMKVQLYAKASNIILKENDNDKLSFLLDILKFNENIPAIATDSNLNIIEYRNIADTNIQVGKKLDKKLQKEFFQYKPVEVQFLDKHQFIYYKDSRIFHQLKYYLNASGNSFYNEIGSNAAFLPVVIFDEKNKLLKSGNIDESILNDTSQLRDYIENLKAEKEPIKIDLGDGKIRYLLFENSIIIKQLKWFPFILYGILAFFLIVTYIAIKNSRKTEKNQIWIGMSKETAHQLGTPISSLGAWLEVLKEDILINSSHQNIIGEMEKDINRLSLVADRFSKIGSKPKLEAENLYEILDNSVQYFRHRASKKVNINYFLEDKSIQILINKQLFEWVIENLIRNALDAITNEGEIFIHCQKDLDNKVIIECRDTGKGIEKGLFEAIFEPGFTTKKRGWGLGLSLCKRIIEDYFKGNIFVKWSKRGEGTIFKIILNSV
jgi:signal transduction histidine kinase